MERKQWVQHISGQGEKWKVLKDDDRLTWCVHKDEDLQCGFFYLPKSEYRLCDPPEVWRDVTRECDPSDEGKLLERNWDSGWIIKHGDRVVTCNDDYRLRKVKAIVQPNEHAVTWAFIVEQKVSE